MNLDQIDKNVDAHDYSLIGRVYENMIRSGEKTNFSKNNREKLKEFLNKLESCRAILEIGVENNIDKILTSTAVILANKDDSSIYIGVDVEDRKHLDNSEKNIYTIQTGSQNISKVMEFARSKGVTEIDFLFIDGWHSIHQCITEFDGYTPYLSKNGIVGLHDINYHPGPRWIMERTDKEKWNIMEFPGDKETDFGIGFVWKK